MELVHTLLSAVGKTSFGGEAPEKVGPLQLKPSVVRAMVGANTSYWAEVALVSLRAEAVRLAAAGRCGQEL